VTTTAPAPADTATVAVTIDGHTLTVPAGTTIWTAARDAGIDIPVLCHDERMDPVGVCRMCVVDVGGRVLAASCVRPCEDGMTVTTTSDDIERSRATLTELLLADQPAPADDPKQTTTGDNLLLGLADRYGVTAGELSPGPGRGTDASNPVIAVNHDACILCDRCVRACDDLQGNDVIGRSGKGYATRISFDLDDPMGSSSCVTCGECVAACPTGALTNKPIHDVPIRPRTELDAVDSVCPYCGVGCAITYYVDRDRGAIAFAEGRDQPGSQGRLCVKGRYGWDYAASPQRLTVPLIRIDESYPKGPLSGDVIGGDSGTGKRRRKPGGLVPYDEVLPHFREATWDEALDLVARRLREVHAERGPAGIAGFGSAKCSNEEAYLFQKLLRTAFTTNNVDHCTRLCHASSVAALFEGIGSGAVSTTYGDVANSDVILITGSNATANHPVASSFFKQARRDGMTVIYVDPRADKLADHADIYCQLKPGTDVAFYNAIMHEVIRLGLVDEAYVAARTSNYDELARTVADYSPERGEQITGVPADVIRQVARVWGEAKAGIIFWGMGISQHTTGTDNARCLIALCAITGNVGKPGAGLHPLRGQNNVQGASDSGLIPMFFPDYQSTDDPVVVARFEQAWGVPLPPKRGLTVTEIVHSVLEGGPDGTPGVGAMYMMGENPFMSDPNTNLVRKALSALDFLVVQDIFVTETAEFADVILPATSYLEKEGTYTNTDRRVQRGRTVLAPPGEARADWWITQEIARRVGLDWSYSSPREVFDEMVPLMPSYRNLSWDNLGGTGKLYPNDDPEHSDGTVVMFDERFNTADGLAHLVPAEWLPARELPDEEYPFVLNTGRLLEHWHTGSMTRRSFALDTIAPRAEVYLNPDDAHRLGLVDGAMARVRSRRGEIELHVLVSSREARGNVFIPFHFREASANLLTIDAIDPVGKIPEFKFCAVAVEPAGTPA
jgi:formate dehydrogenase major subunit